jgi:hypothetical protein
MTIWKRQVGIVAAVLGGAAAVAGAAFPGKTMTSTSPESRTPPSGNRSPVLVELFTSEGCSSCPPADTLLQELVSKQSISGVRVIALSEHVDYWNRLGWTDPYSSPLFSMRQGAYAKSFRNPQVYTPQMVVDGQAEFLGSDRRLAQTAIRRAARRPKATIKIRRGAEGISVVVRDVPQGTGASDVYAAVTENNLKSNVQTGENAGRNLGHTAVARELTRIGTLTSGKQFEGTFLPQTVGSPKNQNIVVFVQEQRTGKVVGVEEVPIGG